MIDLRGLKVRVETREECEKLFEMARGQGFKGRTLYNASTTFSRCYSFS